MALNPSNSSNLEQLALKGLTWTAQMQRCSTHLGASRTLYRGLGLEISGLDLGLGFAKRFLVVLS